MKSEAFRLLGTCFLSFLFFVLFQVPCHAQDVAEIEKRLLQKAGDNIEQFRKGQVELKFKTSKGRVIKNAEVKIVQKTHDFLFGCIVFDLTRGESIYREELFKQRFQKIFNLAVFPFYWPGYEPQQGKPGWNRLMDALDWCNSNGITTKGHPLVWACKSGVPKWLEGYSVKETEALSKARVINIVRGFRDNIDIWDVVNEPVNVKTWNNKVSNLDDERDWDVQDPIPEVADYVEKALEWAYESNPEASLIINEFNTIVRHEVRERFNHLLKELEQRKAPISGIGIQAHEPRQEWYAPQELWNTLDLYSKFGHPLHITEFHPQSVGKDITGGWRTGKWTEETQSEFTEQFVRLCFGHPAVSSINWWGFSDRNIWLPGGGLVDENYNPKPVYEMLDNLINREWKTTINTRLDKKGVVSFRGFFGEYKVLLTTVEGKKKSYIIHVRKNEANTWEFTVYE